MTWKCSNQSNQHNNELYNTWLSHRLVVKMRKSLFSHVWTFLFGVDCNGSIKVTRWLASLFTLEPKAQSRKKSTRLCSASDSENLILKNFFLLSSYALEPKEKMRLVVVQGWNEMAEVSLASRGQIFYIILQQDPKENWIGQPTVNLDALLCLPLQLVS